MSASQLHKKITMDKLPPKARIPHSLNKLPRNQIQRDYSPTVWKEYWDNRKFITIDNDRFCIYNRGSSGPVLLLLHGGGFSALTWSLFSSKITDLVECRTVAIDLRGHGDTHTNNDDDLSLDTLSTDIQRVVNELYPPCHQQPNVILIGHSMGGAVAVDVAHRQLIPSLLALTVIDVVEGSAMEALSSMKSVLRGRPQHFPSLERAIEWSYRSAHIRNLESAKVSMVGQLKPKSSGGVASSCVEQVERAVVGPNNSTGGHSDLPGGSILAGADSIPEDSEVTDPQAGPVGPADTGYAWRIDLARTGPHWAGWFSRLSTKFLEISGAPKLLLLAGVNRLDRELTVGQMQGKFQMQVLPQSGHAVHEDVPDKVSDAVATFLVRNKFVPSTDKFNRVFPSC